MAYAAISPLLAVATKSAKKKIPGVTPVVPVAPAPAPAAAAVAAAPQSYSYSDDPGLASAHALWDPQLGPGGSLASTAAANRRQALIDFGYDPALSGLYGDSATSQAAQANPFSTLANLLRAHTQGVTNINESENKANLWYSGHRGKVLGDEQTNYLGQQAAAGSSLRNLLSGIATNLLNQQNQGYGALSGAEQTAYGNSLNFALQNQQFSPTPSATATSPIPAGGSQATVKRALQSAARRRIRVR